MGGGRVGAGGVVWGRGVGGVRVVMTRSHGCKTRPKRIRT